MNTIKKRAIDLRKKGHSYNHISSKLGIAKSTLSYWLKDMPFALNEETTRRIGEARLKSARFKNAQKIKSQQRAQQIAKQDIGNITNRDLFMLGLGIYIGEGSKTNHIIRVINSDPRIINLAIKWFQTACSLEKDNFTLAIHLYPDNNIKQALTFWSKETSIPLSQFGKTQIDRRINKSPKRSKKLPHGTAHLTIRSNNKKDFGVFLFRRIMFWIDIVLDNNAGIV